MFVPDVIHCDDVPDIKFKLPDASILNWAVLNFNVIVFVVFKNGFEKANYFVLYWLYYLRMHLHLFLMGRRLNQ